MAVDGKVKGRAATGNSIIRFFKEIRAEFSRITWASKEKTKKSIVAVLIFIAIWVLITAGMDVSFKKIFEWIFIELK